MDKFRVVEEGQLYRHFKGTKHKIICIAKDSENLKDMVVYTHEEDGTIWVRPLDIFLSKVDFAKYPNSTQEYRFELIKSNT